MIERIHQLLLESCSLANKNNDKLDFASSLVINLSDKLEKCDFASKFEIDKVNFNYKEDKFVVGLIVVEKVKMSAIELDYKINLQR